MRPNCAYHRDHPHTNTECCRNRWHPSLSCQTAMNGLPFVWVFNTGLQGLYIHTYIQQLQQHTAYSSNFVHSVLLLAIPWLVHACNSKQIIQCVRWHKPSAHPHQKYIYVCYVKTRVHEDHLFIFNVAFYEWQEKKTTGLNCATCTEHNRIDVSFYCSNIRDLSLHCIARSQILHKFVIHTSPVCCIIQLVLSNVFLCKCYGWHLFLLLTIWTTCCGANWGQIDSISGQNPLAIYKHIIGNGDVWNLLFMEDGRWMILYWQTNWIWIAVEIAVLDNIFWMNCTCLILNKIILRCTEE